MQDRFLDLINEIYELFVLLREGDLRARRKIMGRMRNIDVIWERIKKRILETFV